MIEAATVWAVQLRRGAARETKGSLAIEANALVFRASDGSGDYRIPLSDVLKARRVLGSPILIVHYAAHGRRAQTAFYFVQPPPLEPPSSATAVSLRSAAPLSFSPFGRMTKRKARKVNVGYLSNENRTKKEQVKQWERAVREAAVAARG